LRFTQRGIMTEFEGKQALFVVNLKPRKMMGEISERMARWPEDGSKIKLYASAVRKTG
jgi:tRNA-binding EMAP/Myf-like protein